MGILWDKITSQFIEIIEWSDDDHETLVWRFPVRGNEIKNGAKLVVREGQTALLVNEGKLADSFGPGTYTLSTQNLPILATLKGWKYGFNSPFKAEVYFVTNTVFTDLKWGTQNPIMLRDPEFGPIRLRAFGIFSIKVGDATKFLRTCAGTDGSFEVDEIIGQLKRNLVSRFTGALAKAKVPALDLAGNYEEISNAIMPTIRGDFEELGIEIKKFLIENISLPPAVEKILDKRTEMGIIGNMQQFAAYQAASAIPDAAKAPNSMAGAGMGLAAGMAMGGQMANAMGGMYGPQGGQMQPGMQQGMHPGMQQQGMHPGMQQQMPQQGMAGGMAGAQASQRPAPAQEGGGKGDMVTRLKKLDALKAAGVLNEDEYNSKRNEILAEL